MTAANNKLQLRNVDTNKKGGIQMVQSLKKVKLSKMYKILDGIEITYILQDTRLHMIKNKHKG